MSKYALIDGEIHKHDRDTDSFVPLTLAEAQAVVDTMNQVHADPALKKWLSDIKHMEAKDHG